MKVRSGDKSGAKRLFGRRVQGHDSSFDNSKYNQLPELNMTEFGECRENERGDRKNRPCNNHHSSDFEPIDKNTALENKKRGRQCDGNHEQPQSSGSSEHLHDDPGTSQLMRPCPDHGNCLNQKKLAKTGVLKWRKASC